MRDLPSFGSLCCDLVGFLACWAAFASAQPERPERTPFLQWEFAAQAFPDGQGEWYFQRAVSLMDGDGKAVWRAELPPRMRAYQAGIGAAEADAHRQYPRQAAEQFPFLCGIHWTPEAVAIGDLSGLLVLRCRDGTPLLDAPSPAGDRAGFYVDDGTFELRSGAESCRGKARRGRFLAACGARLVQFDGRTLALFGTSPYRLERQVAYVEAEHRRPAPSPRVAARFAVDGLEVLLEGIVYR